MYQELTLMLLLLLWGFFDFSLLIGLAELKPMKRNDESKMLENIASKHAEWRLREQHKKIINFKSFKSVKDLWHWIMKKVIGSTFLPFIFNSLRYVIALHPLLRWSKIFFWQLKFFKNSCKVFLFLIFIPFSP